MTVTGQRAAALRTTALRGAALGFVLLDAALVQARSGPLDGIRAISSATPDTSGDAQALGRTRLAADDVAGALGAFRQALAQNPQSVDALNGIGVCYARLGQYGLSRTYYELALVAAPGSAMVLNNLGYSLYLQGELQAARVPLTAAAASEDTLASAAARHTLALIEADAERAGPAIVSVAVAQAHIEQSDDGEQRLVTRAEPATAVAVAALGDEARLVAVAPAWTAHDDAALVAEERADEAAAAAVAAPAAAAPVASAAAPVVPVATAAARSASIAQPGGFQAAGSTSTASAWLVSRPAPAAPRASAPPRLSGLTPTPRDRRTGFDSDDGDLNAFAARMQGDSGVTVAEERAAAVARLEALVARLARS